jgi:hypothetical protein
MKLIFYTIFSYMLTSSILFCSVKPDENALMMHDKKSVVVSCNPELKFNPYNDNRHTVNINNIDSEYPCLQLFGESLRECMKAQSKECAMKHFKKFNIRTAQYYLMLLYMSEFKEFLSLFTENDWQEYLNQLPAQDRSQMPQTIKEQVDIIAKAYRETYELEGWFGLRRFFSVSEQTGTEPWWKEMRRQQMIRPDQEEHLYRIFEALRRQLYKKQ